MGGVPDGDHATHHTRSVWPSSTCTSSSAAVGLHDVSITLTQCIDARMPDALRPSSEQQGAGLWADPSVAGT